MQSRSTSTSTEGPVTREVLETVLNHLYKLQNFKPFRILENLIDLKTSTNRDIGQRNTSAEPAILFADLDLNVNSLEGIRLDDPRNRGGLKNTTGGKTEEITVSIADTDKVYPFSGVPGLFVGHENVITPQRDYLERRKHEVLPRLLTDVGEFQKKIARTKMGRKSPPQIAPELRMSGYVTDGNATHVTLSPRIWILYNDKWRKQVNKFVEESEWLAHEGFGKPEIHKGSLRLSCVSPRSPIEGLSLQPSQAMSLGNDVDLYLHVENTHRDSAAGLVCCATVVKDGVIAGQRISRIGGILLINGRAMALTTAHGILELGWEILFDEENYADPDSDMEDLEWSDDDSDYSNNSETPWPSIDYQNITEWTSVEILGTTSFLGNQGLDPKTFIPQMHRRMTVNYRDTDFSLWHVPELGPLKNQYEGEDTVKTTVTRLAWTCGAKGTETTGGQIKVVLGPDNILEGYCLPRRNSFMIRGKIFETQKLRLLEPLALGCSGAWVVVNDELCGMIVASYDSEPYAHMVTCEDIVNDIREAHCPRLGRFPNVELPVEKKEKGGRADLIRVHYGIEKYMNRRTDITTLIQIMMEEEDHAARQHSMVLLHMTLPKRQQVLEKLSRWRAESEEVAKVFPLWFVSAHEDHRARLLLKFRAQVLLQYPPYTLDIYRPNKALSLTAKELDESHVIMETIVRDLNLLLPGLAKWQADGESNSKFSPASPPTGKTKPPEYTALESQQVVKDIRWMSKMARAGFYKTDSNRFLQNRTQEMDHFLKHVNSGINPFTVISRIVELFPGILSSETLDLCQAQGDIFRASNKHSRQVQEIPMTKTPPGVGFLPHQLGKNYNVGDPKISRYTGQHPIPGPRK
ncbi:hypothetical protein QBC43DRAFT_310263 [Cladorrhinum sp. PSN259]|nr:hypothetical protein QBC43DRAFT_310263 [Cladorrhinum sp. PSN259]